MYPTLFPTLVEYIKTMLFNPHPFRKTGKFKGQQQKLKFMLGWALFRDHFSMSSRSLQAFLHHVCSGYQNGVRIQLKATSRSLVTNFSQTGGQYHQGVRLNPLMGVATFGFWNYFGREESDTTPKNRLVLLPRLQAAERKSDEEGPK